MKLFGRSKYKAIKTNGHASKKEDKMIQELKEKEQAGEIRDLKEQVKFELIPSQKNEKGNLRGCCYIADATYYDKDGVFHCVDIKGFKTDIYKIKKKLMLEKHGIYIEEI